MTRTAILVALLMAYSMIGQAQSTLTYQGQLADAAHRSVNASYPMTFTLYLSQEGVEAVWSEMHGSVGVVDGVFTVDLGSVTAFPAALGQNDALYLGVSVNESPEMRPRMRVGSALRAQWAETARHAVDVRGEDIHPATVGIGDQPVINAEGQWVGDPSGLRGPVGSEGSMGPAGAQGPEGPVGSQGPEGPAGAQGPEGPAGSQGPEGPAGSQGPEGPVGSQGPEGPAGVQGRPGDRGTIGPAGEAGVNGADGPQGPPGPPGDVGQPGDRGPQGLAGTPGQRGEPGAVGSQGERGEQGVRGEIGLQGVDGAHGVAGPVGERGEPGPQGPSGDIGPVGPPGPAGIQGAVGSAGRDGLAAQLVCENGGLVEYANGVWVCSEHQGNPDAHHPADGAGIDMRPNSVAVGASRLTDGELDLGPEADDSLSAAMLQTLVAGGNADALHGHAAQGAGGGGGSCYTALGTGECGAGYGAMYSGILVNASQGTWGSVGPVCIRSEALTFNAESQYWQYFYAIGAGRRFRAEGNAISCAMCCPGAGAADEN